MESHSGRNSLYRRTGNGGVRILYSGWLDDIHREVAIILNKKTKQPYVEHESIFSRIISVMLKGIQRNVKIITVYETSRGIRSR